MYVCELFYCIRKGRDKGYTVKYSPPPEGVLEPERTPEGGGLYLTVYPKLSPTTVSEAQ